ncbi:MAG TPA: acyl-CoA thioesterase [Acidiferrobacteraceae bacterium]|nr:acyl-CoA thioesterase [Acidiferrobacteraceae bacterium]
MDYSFKLDFKVRDYECDIQGVVNNGVYQNYLEHARHEFLLVSGIDFAELVKQGVNLVVTRAELDYKYPLHSGEAFWVGLNLQQLSRIKFAFLQDIYRLSDDKLIVSARIMGVALNERGRPFIYAPVVGLCQQ